MHGTLPVSASAHRDVGGDMGPWQCRRHRQMLSSVLIATALSAAGAVPYGAAQSAPEPQIFHWEHNGQPGTGTVSPTT